MAAVRPEGKPISIKDKKVKEVSLTRPNFPTNRTNLVLV